jgi:hypothetical protein
MTFEYLLYTFMLIIFIICIFFIKKYINQQDKLPERTTINLPAEINFKKTANNEYGFGTLTLDIFTLGGHGRLKEARFNYETNYENYAQHFNQSIKLRKQINSNLNHIGELTFIILNELEKSQKMLKKESKNTFISNFSRINTANHQLTKLKSITTNNANSGMILLQGSAIGGLAAIGSWTLVSLLGTASTGTAIASLSGIAAHNAILAWFGGGALAAGGGGMAAGTITLGAIIAVPILIFASYKTHNSADEIEQKNLSLTKEIEKIKQANTSLMDINALIQQQTQLLNSQLKKIKIVNEKAYELLYPNGPFSIMKRSFNDILNKNFYTKEEARMLDELSNSIDDFYSLLHRKDVFTNNQLEYKI